MICISFEPAYPVGNSENSPKYLFTSITLFEQKDILQLIKPNDRKHMDITNVNGNFERIKYVAKKHYPS